MSATIICGFPGVGKSYLVDRIKKEEFDIKILDSDSSNFSWISEGVRNPDFPNNYIKHIKDNIDNYDIILVSSHGIVREALKENGIHYTLVYPDLSLKYEYIDRYIKRGSSDSFIDMMSENWIKFIKECGSEHFCFKYKLNKGQYLSDIVIRSWMLRGRDNNDKIFLL